MLMHHAVGGSAARNAAAAVLLSRTYPPLWDVPPRAWRCGAGAMAARSLRVEQAPFYLPRPHEQDKQRTCSRCTAEGFHLLHTPAARCCS